MPAADGHLITGENRRRGPHAKQRVPRVLSLVHLLFGCGRPMSGGASGAAKGAAGIARTSVVPPTSSCHQG